MKSYEIERMFNSESYGKKKIGRGVYNRASRKGFIRGGVKTQYDYMSTKERKKLNGEIRVSNMYSDLSNLPTLEEIKKMDKEKGHNILSTARENNTSKAIMEKLGISSGSLYGLYDKFNVYYPKRKKKQAAIVVANSDITLNLKHRQDVQNEILKINKVRNSLKTRKEFKFFVENIVTKRQFGYFSMMDRRNFLLYCKDFLGATSLALLWDSNVNTISKILARNNIKREDHFKNSINILDLLKRYNPSLSFPDMSSSKTVVENGVDGNIVPTPKEIESSAGEEVVEIIQPEKIDNQLKEFYENKIAELEQKIAELSKEQSNPSEKINSATIGLAGNYIKEDLKKRLAPVLGMLVDNVEYSIELKLSEIVK